MCNMLIHSLSKYLLSIHYMSEHCTSHWVYKISNNIESDCIIMLKQKERIKES